MREAKIFHTTHPLVAIALAVGLLGLVPVPSADATGGPGAIPLSGTPRVIDGDTLELDGSRIRLDGIDAPESSQSCPRKGLGSWACGTAATTALGKLVEHQTVSCQPQGFDKYGRTLAVCFVGNKDINAAMVRQGYAWAFVKYSSLYVQQEAQARSEGVGIWQAAATPAWDYRHRQWGAAEPAAPAGCAIKGNVTKHGKIYHMPWSPWYTQIRMETAKGKRWFCTEAEAVAAGWRPVQGH
jgi:endonuclease YncB( thermonuclease family)